jgi:hypothetical protein
MAAQDSSIAAASFYYRSGFRSVFHAQGVKDDYGLLQYGWQFEAYRYKGFMYNLGRGLVWSISVFPEFGKFISDVIWIIVIVAILLFEKERRDR